MQCPDKFLTVRHREGGQVGQRPPTRDLAVRPYLFRVNIEKDSIKVAQWPVCRGWPST